MILNEIIQVIHPLQVVGNTDDLQGLDIQHLLTDSRQLGNAPEATLFFALKTHKNDGAKYIPQLDKQGVRAFVLTQEQYNGLSGSGNQESGVGTQKTLIIVEDVVVENGDLTVAYRRLLLERRARATDLVHLHL